MRIAVLTKVVPRQAVALRIDPSTNRLDRTGAAELSPGDQHAVEEALLIRERLGDGEVVALSMGPEDGAESLRAALAMGADRAVIAADPALAGSDLLGTSRVLAALVAREAPDLVILGSQSPDGGGAMLWAALAERLGWPLLSGSRDVQVADRAVRATRTVPDGELVLSAPLPCVVALSGAVNQPRYPSFRDVIAAKRREIARVTATELGCSPADCGVAGARTTVLRVAAAPATRKAGTVVADDGHAAEWLLRFLGERGVA